jgi:hypothetical protein
LGDKTEASLDMHFARVSKSKIISKN